MSSLRQQAATATSNVPLSVIGMLLFLAVFIGVVFWVFRKKSKTFYQRMSRLPLEDTKEQSNE